MAPQKPCSFKSKPKKDMSDNPRKVRSYKKKRTKIDDLYHDDDAKISVMDRADEVLKTIPAKYPSFVKNMLPSNVSYSYWLILPVEFCKLHLPWRDAKVTLVDELGEEKETTYLVHRHGLSAGWRGFSIAHRLLKGDILVFHLVSPCKLKVNIVRVYGLDIADAALLLMHMRSFGGRTGSDDVVKEERTHIKAKKKCMKSLLLEMDQCEEVPGKSQSPSTSTGITENQSENQFDEFDAEDLEQVSVDDSVMTNYQQGSELGYCGTFLMQNHFQKGIDCK